jgi:hypothetical protein
MTKLALAAVTSAVKRLLAEKNKVAGVELVRFAAAPTSH